MEGGVKDEGRIVQRASHSRARGMAGPLKVVVVAKRKLLTFLMQFDTKFNSVFYSNYKRIAQVEIRK